MHFGSLSPDASERIIAAKSPRHVTRYREDQRGSFVRMRDSPAREIHKEQSGMMNHERGRTLAEERVPFSGAAITVGKNRFGSRGTSDRHLRVPRRAERFVIYHPDPPPRRHYYEASVMPQSGDDSCKSVSATLRTPKSDVLDRFDESIDTYFECSE